MLREMHEGLGGHYGSNSTSQPALARVWKGRRKLMIRWSMVQPKRTRAERLAKSNSETVSTTSMARERSVTPNRCPIKQCNVVVWMAFAEAIEVTAKERQTGRHGSAQRGAGDWQMQWTLPQVWWKCVSGG